jgi:hypothetical protein
MVLQRNHWLYNPWKACKLRVEMPLPALFSEIIHFFFAGSHRAVCTVEIKVSTARYQLV